MANAAYDHIIAIVIVGAIFIGTVVALPAINYSNFQNIDQQQLRNTALNVFSSMLWNTGSPANWGSTFPFDQNDVETFGLAYSGAFSKFILDSNKVQRLDTASPGYIGYSRVRDLLELQEYGFQLSLYRPFRVEWSLQVTNRTVKFSVYVLRTEDATPIPNAKVSVTTMVTASKLQKDNEDVIYQPFNPKTYFTDAKGYCGDTQNLNSTLKEYSIDYAVAIMHISVSGMTTTVIAQNANPITKFIKVHTFEDTITLSFNDELSEGETSSERRIIDIEAFDLENLIQIFDGRNTKPPGLKITHGEGYEYWQMKFNGLRALDPSALLFVVQLTLQGKGRVLVLIAGPFAFGDPEKVFQFGPEPTEEDVIAVMRRFVVISDITYVASITLWKE